MEFTEKQIRTVFIALRDRRLDPEGDFDRRGRWYPSASEDADHYTNRIRSPSRTYPYTYMCAARTLRHCRALASANPTLFARKLAKVEAIRSEIASES